MPHILEQLYDISNEPRRVDPVSARQTNNDAKPQARSAGKRRAPRITPAAREKARAGAFNRVCSRSSPMQICSAAFQRADSRSLAGCMTRRPNQMSIARESRSVCLSRSLAAFIIARGAGWPRSSRGWPNTGQVLVSRSARVLSGIFFGRACSGF